VASSTALLFEVIRMPLRPPGRPSPTCLPPQGMVALDYEIAHEQASSLGRAGRRVAETLAALAACERTAAGRDALVRDAAAAVWAYFVHREMIGFRRHDDAVRVYGIPRDVLARLGAG
jgi:hypothetical protein